MFNTFFQAGWNIFQGLRPPAPPIYGSASQRAPYSTFHRSYNSVT